MNYYDITTAIRRMAFKRLARGATKENVIARLEKLKVTAWKHNTGIQEYINAKIKEIESIPELPMETLQFVRQYAHKYLSIQSEPYNISDSCFDRTFANCALPLNPKFYPILRVEIFKLVLLYQNI